MKKKKGFTLVELLVVISIIALLLAVLMPALQKARELAKRTICSNQIKQIGIGMAGYAMGFDDKMPWAGGITDDRPDDTKDESTPHPSVVWRTNHSSNDAIYTDKSIKCVCGQMGKALPMRLACLFAGNYVRDGKVFYCPSNTTTARKYDTYTNQDPAQGGPSSEWSRPHQLCNKDDSDDWIRTGYDFFPIDKKYNGSNSRIMLKDAKSSKYYPEFTCKKFSNLHQIDPYLTDVMGSPERISHRSGLRSVGTNKVPVNAGISAIYKDGHVKFMTDKVVTVNGATVKLLDYTNKVWDYAPDDDTDDSRTAHPYVFFYYMFELVGKSKVSY